MPRIALEEEIARALFSQSALDGVVPTLSVVDRLERHRPIWRSETRKFGLRPINGSLRLEPARLCPKHHGKEAHDRYSYRHEEVFFHGTHSIAFEGATPIAPWGP